MCAATLCRCWLGSYGTTLTELFGTVAEQVDSTLKGATVPEVPIRQPTRLEMVPNLKVARMLGITVPTTMRGLADDVIE